MIAKLLFLDDDKGEESYELKPEGTTIGRETDNDIVLQEGEISRHHARILQKDGQWVFKDLGSNIGTTVNDQPVKESEQILYPGDLIVMGRHRFKFEPGVSEVTIMGNLRAPTSEDLEKAKQEAEESTPQEPAEEESGEEKAPETPLESPYVKEKTPKPEPEEPATKSEPAKEEPKPKKSSAMPMQEQKKKGGGKGLLGCGGCGCLLTLVLLIGGISMLFIGTNSSHLTELTPWGVAVAILSVITGFVSLILLIIALVKKKKD